MKGEIIEDLKASAEAYISEIYPSIQGEGPYTGEKHIFVRLAGCPLRCDYCDTPESLTVQGHPKLKSEEVLKQVIQLSQDRNFKTVSLTGGEPLTQPLFLMDLLPKLKLAGLKIYLETAGVHWKSLQQVVGYCDVISMDIKLPSATGQVFWNEHRKFLEIGRGKTFVKVVIENHTQEDEVETMVRLVSEIRPIPLLVLQSVTPISNQIKSPSPQKLSRFYGVARSRIPQVLIMTQKHKEWGIR